MHFSRKRYPGISAFRARLIPRIAAVLCVLVPLLARPQETWNPQVTVNRQSFNGDSSPPGKDAKSDQRSSTTHVESADSDISDIQMGIEAMIQAEIPPAVEETFSPFPATFSLGAIAAWPQRAPHAASVTVGELAVPGKAYKALQKASQAFRKGRLEEARSETARALTLWPHYSDAMVLSSLLYLYDRRSREARAAAEQAIGVDGTNGMAYVVLASALNFAGQYDDALRALENALRFRPDAWQAYFERARAEIGKEDFRSALVDTVRAGEIAPAKTSVVHLLKGVALLKLNRRSEAAFEIHTYLQTNPTGNIAELARLMIERSTTQP